MATAVETEHAALHSAGALDLSNEQLLEDIDNTTLNDKLPVWKRMQMDARPRIRAERALLAAESWKRTRGEDVQIRRAKLLAHVLENIPVHIHDWQLLAGSESEDIFGVHPDVDQSTSVTVAAMNSDSLPVGNPEVSGIVTEEERQSLLECAEVFRGDTVFEHVEQAWVDAFGTNPSNWFSALQFLGKPGPFYKAPVELEKIVREGLRCTIDEAKAKISEFKASFEADVDRLYFWKSVVIVLEAMVVYANRHAEHASSLAAAEAAPARRAELEQMAEACRRVPEHPARTLQEGFQAVVFTLLGLKLETPHLPGDSGRMDQYLWDLFRNDYEQGATSLQRAGELFACHLAYRAGVTSLNDPSFMDMSQTVTELNLITLGGVDRDGRSADNALTYLFLHVGGLLGLPEPHLTLRWHPETPQRVMRKAHEVSLKVGGNPQFVSDGPVEEFWTARGVPVEKARDSSGLGCLPPLVPGTTYYNIGCVSHAKTLELTLHNGRDPLLDRCIGLETGDPLEFESFEQLYAAYQAQYEFWVARLARMARISYHVEHQYLRTPFFSSIFDGCIERGRDLAFRDVPGCHHFINDRATIDGGDSLIAIQKLVFEEKKLTLAELIEALDSNFAGDRGEEIRQLCLAAPKYGNDIDEVDRMAGELGAFGGRTIRSHTMPNGVPIQIGRPGVSWHYFAGAKTGALPNGRRSREPLNDATLSPMRGQDRHGPTAVLRSVLKAGFRESLFNTLNQRVSPSAVRSPETMDKLVGLTQRYLENGGMHTQYNIVDTETMRRAQQTPEEHKDLVVRIGGFSAYFVQLSKTMQDDVIMRTEQGI